MIICDIQQLIYANVMAMVFKEKDTVLTENIIRHMTLNSIRLIKNMFHTKYGEIIIACDNKTSYWRRTLFPYYKAHRKELKEKQTQIDWPMINRSIDNIVQELADNFSYRVINVEGAEADDVIASLCSRFSNDMRYPILIISRDHDFFQLHGNMNVEQYDWINRKYIRCDNPELTLKEHIIRGDSGDGIPNVLSLDNAIVMKMRQSPITTARLEKFLDFGFKNQDQQIKRNYERNKHLIDFSFIPDEIHDRIHESFDRQENKPKKNLLNYFIAKRLKELTPLLNEFV